MGGGAGRRGLRLGSAVYLMGWRRGLGVITPKVIFADP